MIMLQSFHWYDPKIARFSTCSLLTKVLFVILMACGFINIAYGGGKLKILVPMDEYFKGVMVSAFQASLYDLG